MQISLTGIMAEIGLDAGGGQDGVLVENFWESFRLDPRQADNAPMRASDADRELVRAVLVDAYGDGRLTREEYDDRLNTLYGSLTLGELPSLVGDLMPSARIGHRVRGCPAGEAGGQGRAPGLSAGPR